MPLWICWRNLTSLWRHRTIYIYITGELWGAIVNMLKKFDLVMTAPHYIYIYIYNGRAMGCHCEYVEEIWPRYDGTALYIYITGELWGAIVNMLKKFDLVMTAPHYIYITGELWGAIVNMLKKFDLVMTAPHCIYIYIYIYVHVSWGCGHCICTEMDIHGVCIRENFISMNVRRICSKASF